jgi:peroxiredoxin
MNVQLLFVSYGDAEANMRMAGEYNLKAPVLLQKSGETIEAFASFGTPVGYLIDPEGRVAQPLAIGAEKLPLLVRDILSGEATHANADRNGVAHANAAAHAALPGARPLTESRIPRDGLKAGTPAPSFTLPDVHGKQVSLEDYRGRRVLLVFSDPNCGPCDEMAGDLNRVEREHRNNNLAVVMVGRGDLEENRRKAEQHGFEFPVVMQEKWKLSKEYGIFATPVAYLIDEHGVLRSDVAMGSTQILALADEH